MTTTPDRRTGAPAKTETPWGRAAVVEELRIAQRAGDKRFATVLQLLETPAGERLVRFSYSTGGTGRRGPVTLRPRDVAKLHEELAARPALAAALGFGGDA